MQMNICLRDLPTQKNSTLPPRMPTHAYADCKISGQQPTQLYKEFPRVHGVGHWEKTMLSWFSPSLFIQLFPQLFPFVFHHFIFPPSNSLNHQFLSVTSTSTEDSGTPWNARRFTHNQSVQKKIPHRKSTDFIWFQPDFTVRLPLESYVLPSSGSHHLPTVYPTY